MIEGVGANTSERVEFLSVEGGKSGVGAHVLAKGIVSFETLAAPVPPAARSKGCLERWIALLWDAVCRICGCGPKKTAPTAAVLDKPKMLSIPLGDKTIPMLRALEEGVLKAYNPKNQTLAHQGISYLVLKGDNKSLPAAPVMCIGSHPTSREIIALDPKNSPFLDAKYNQMIASLKEKEGLSIKETLEFIYNYVKTTVFYKNASESQVDAFINKWKTDHKDKIERFTLAKSGERVAVIPIDDFIESGVGICRHHALVLTYFLSKISKENTYLPKGKAFFVRDNIMAGGHAWALYIPQDMRTAWHIDSLWGKLKNLLDLSERRALYPYYGKEAIHNEIKRFIIPSMKTTRI